MANETPIKYRQFIDLETHEVVSGGDIYKRYSEEEAKTVSRFEWARFYPRNVGLIQKALSFASLDVFMYLVRHVSFGDNQFTCSQTEVAEKTGISRPTVSRVFKGLQDYNVIRRVKGSTWMFNPTVMHAGNKHMGLVLYNIYQKLKPSKWRVAQLQEPLDYDIENLLSVETLFDDKVNPIGGGENENDF